MATRSWRNEQTITLRAIDAAAKAEPVDESAPPSTRLREKRRRKDERSLILAKSAVCVLAIAAFVAAGGAWSMKAWYNSKFNQVASLDQQSVDIKDAPAQLGDENFLIVGSDTRAGLKREHGETGIGTESKVDGARSDTVMLAHIPADRARAVVVSFPRDLEVTRPKCARWNAKTGAYSAESAPKAKAVKLNTAYAVGGPRCVTKLIQQMTGLRMNHFVGLDFNGFRDMVDAVGGVKVKIDGPIVDGELGTIATKAGTLNLDGKTALSFVRARKVTGDPTSDYGRIKRQQQFIAALLGKAMSRDVLLDASRLTGFINAFTSSTFGENIGVDAMLTLAQSMQDMSGDTIDFITAPTSGYANERGNEVLLDFEADQLFNALIENGPLPGSELEEAQEESGDQAKAKTSVQPTG